MENVIDKIRKRRGLTYREISTESGLTELTIRNAGNGKTYDPGIRTLRAIAKVLHAEVDEIFPDGI